MSRNMNPSQARVIDPILSRHARGYRNAQTIGHLILPYVDVQLRGGTIIKFGKEGFRKYAARRAPGARVERVTFGYGSGKFSLTQDALEGVVPTETAEEARKVPGIDLGRHAVERVQDIMSLNREAEIADLVRNTATYAASNVETVSGTDVWTDPASDPGQQMDDAEEVVRARIGLRPNTATMGPKAYKAAKRHPKVIDTFKHTAGGVITHSMLEEYFSKKILVGDAVVLPDDAADDDPAEDIWGGDVILHYTPQASQDYMVPSFGYTYRLAGSPVVEQPYYERNVKSWVYPVTEETEPVVAGPDAGFLIKGAA